MWCKVRDFLVGLLLTENAIRSIAGACGLNEEKATAVAKGIMNIKYFIDTKDKRYINQSIDELQKLI